MLSKIHTAFYPKHRGHTECVLSKAQWVFSIQKTHTMGWLRLVGSVKLQVSFAKEPYKRDYILQKRLITATPLCVLCVLDTLTTAPQHTSTVHIQHKHKLTTTLTVTAQRTNTHSYKTHTNSKPKTHKHTHSKQHNAQTQNSWKTQTHTHQKKINPLTTTLLHTKTRTPNDTSHKHNTHEKHKHSHQRNKKHITHNTTTHKHTHTKQHTAQTQLPWKTQAHTHQKN